MKPFVRFAWIAVVGAACAWFLPGTAAERFLLEASLHGVINPPREIEGKGSQQDPWAVRTLVGKRRGQMHEAPAVVGFDDDSQGIFESVPPSPMDVAVVLLKLRGLGVTEVALAMPLAWQAPDVFELTGLETELGKFSSLVSSVPLTRSVAEQPLPPEFRRASLAIHEVQGDVSALPVVNRVAMPDVMLGGEKALAGFSVLESEPLTAAPYLVAKWDDRVVFSFAVLAVIQRLNLPVDEIRLELDGFLKLSPTGPMIPVDSFGRMVRQTKHRVLETISAAACIDATPSDFPELGVAPTILRNDSSGTDASLRRFSDQVVGQVSAIAAAPSMEIVSEIRRLPAKWEALTLLGALLLLFAVDRTPRFARFGLWAVLLAAFLTAYYFGLGQGLLLPMAAAGSMVVAAWLWAMTCSRRA